MALLVSKERKSLTAVALEGVEVNNTLGSLVKLAEVLWINTAFKKHKQGNCIDLFKPYVIGRQFLEADLTVFLSVATSWDLLSIFRSLAAGYLVQLQSDVTSKASTAALNKLGFGVNMLGGHFAPWTYTLIPAETKSEAMYSAAYSASKKATCKLMRLHLCAKEECYTCRIIEQLKEHSTVAGCLKGAPYNSPEKEMPISACLGDNKFSVQNFSTKKLGLDANVCQTNTSAIAANNRSHKKHF